MQDNKSDHSWKHANEVYNLTDNDKLVHDYVLWHHRLGHAPMAKLKCIADLSPLENKNDEVCLTCPIEKFTKLPFPTKYLIIKNYLT